MSKKMTESQKKKPASKKAVAQSFYKGEYTALAKNQDEAKKRVKSVNSQPNSMALSTPKRTTLATAQRIMRRVPSVTPRMRKLK